MAKFHNLLLKSRYDIVSGETGRTLAESIEGSVAMKRTWSKGDIAAPEDEDEWDTFGRPTDVAV